MDHIRPPGANRFSFVFSSEEKVIVLLHSEGLNFIDVKTLNVSNEIIIPGLNDILCVAGSSPKLLFSIGSDGNLTLISANCNKRQLLKETATLEKEDEDEAPIPASGRKKSKSPLDMFDTDEEEYQIIKKERKSLREIKNKYQTEDYDEDERDHLEELDDYNVHSEGNNNIMQVDEVAPKFKDEDKNSNPSRPHHYAPIPECIHQTFQPSSTPMIHGYRFLCWNTVGLVISRQDDGYNSVEVEFHDKAFHRPLRFVDEVGYNLGAVGQGGVILASGRGGGGERKPFQASIIYVSPLDFQERAMPWTIELPLQEEALGVAIGGAKYSVVATSAGFLRTFSSNGLQGPIINYPGKFISMVANERTLFLIYVEESYNNQLCFALYDLDRLALSFSGNVGGRFQNKRLNWIGLCDGKIPGIFDEEMILHICNPDNGYVWEPWLECKESKERKEVVWPIGFTMQDLLCLVLKGKSGDGDGNDDNTTMQYPEPIPRPIQTVIPLRIPLLRVRDDQLVIQYEKAFRTGRILNSVSLRPKDLSDRESKKMQVSADKHVLELLQLAIKADKPARILELCNLFLLDRSWDLAIQLVRHNRLMQLADRIESLKDSRPSIPPTITNYSSKEEESQPPSRVRALRLSKKVAMESPSTPLTNITGTINQEGSFKVESLLVPQKVTCPPDFSTLLLSSTPLNRSPEDNSTCTATTTTTLPPISSNTVASPFSSLSVTNTSPQQPPMIMAPLSFSEMVKSIQQGDHETLSSLERRTQTLELKRKLKISNETNLTSNTANDNNAKSKRQSDLSTFTKKSQAENIPTNSHQS